MATIRKRGQTWQVQVRRDGHPAISKSFSSKALASAWAREREREIERGELAILSRDSRKLTLGDILSRYLSEITPLKRGSCSEACRINALLRHEICSLQLNRLSPYIIAHYRDERLKLVKTDTVRREFNIVRHCLELAKREWGLQIAINPFKLIKYPISSRPRNQRLTPQAEKQFFDALSKGRTWYLKALIEFAIETAMRRGEILNLKWQNINLNDRTAFIENTKNSYPRTIPLSSKAVSILQALPITEARVFPLKADAVSLSWQRLRKRTNQPHLRFHDLRHEAITRFFEMGLSIPEVSLISGHRDTRMLMRYTHLKPEDIAAKLP